MANQNERGKDGVLTVDGTDYPITNFEYDIEENISSTEHNDSEHPEETRISSRLVGTFDYEGSLQELRSALYTPDGIQRDGIRVQYDATEEVTRANNITIQNFNRSHPSDDTTNGTVEFSSTDYRLPN